MIFTLLLGFAAVNTGNNLLFLTVSAMLGFMAVTGILGWLNIRGLALRVQIPDEIYSGLDTLVTIHLVSTRRVLPSFLLKMSLCGGELDIPFLARGGSETASLVTAFPERGVVSLPDAAICSPFPVNFFVRCNNVPTDLRFPVFPNPRSYLLPPGVDGGSKGVTEFSAAKGYEGDLTRITDYRGGEPLKLIHWRLSAKHETLKVKELATVAGEPVLLDLERLPVQGVEEKVSHAAFLVNRLIREHRPVGMVTPAGTIPPDSSRSHRLKLLRELAVYGKN